LASLRRGDVPKNVPIRLPLSVGRLATLPLFFDLAGKRVILAGTTQAAIWKLELLCAAGAKVQVFAEQPSPALATAVEGLSAQLIHCSWLAADFTGATLAFADFDTREEALAFKAAAARARVLANLIDRPDLSDFQMGSIVERSPLVIGISTHGGAPVLARSLRARLEALLPQSLRDWAAAAKTLRPRVEALSTPARRRFWERFAERALTGLDEKPEEKTIADLFETAEMDDLASGSGSVTLVGAGPGDPELLTLKALRALQAADVVLYDDLVSLEIVAMARREAEKIPVGKRGYRPSCPQSEITSLLLSLAQQGKSVVRLKGGDPMIFGRANEEIAALREAHIPVKVVPGVTAALGAAASLGTSLTQREDARRVQFITAHAHDGRLPEDMDWAALADPRATTIVYMGVKTLPALAERLLAHGLEPTTPALLVESATGPNERRITGTIADLPEKVAALAPTGPCIIMIGTVFGNMESAESANADVLVARAAAS
jgi:uroporphyrin-III C-methyltransferase/precorrin-2 dehydrogenase/sirohydrochlorin ferrochelatase